MIKYASYDYYTKVYGGSLDDDLFDKHVIRASAFIRSLVNGKLETDDYDIDDYEEVKYACCEMCDAIDTLESSSASDGGRLVNSVSNDGYSVSYASGGQTAASVEEATNDRLVTIARQYLAETGLLSRCVYR